MFVEDRSYTKKLFSMAVIGGTISSKNENIVFTPKDGGADAVLCSIPKDGTSITNITSTYNTITVNLSDGTSKTWDINNGKNAKVTAEQDAERYKTKINMEYYESDDTKKTEEVFIPHSAIKVEEGENFSETNRTYKISCYNGSPTPTVTTTPNLAPHILLTGTELAGKEDIVKVILDSRIGDTYLNTEDCTYYKRTDKGGVTNKWEYISTVKGEKGDDEVSIWLALPQNYGKTVEDYYNEKQVMGIEIKDVKPNITDAGIKINTQYLYNTDPRIEFKVERLNYPAGNYCFRLSNGKTSSLFKCTSTIDINQTDSSHDGSEFIYVLNKTTRKLELFTENIEKVRTSLGIIDVEFTPTIPEGYTSVVVTDFDIMGTWKSISWRGTESNYICIERNEEEIQVDLTNYYSKPEIDGIVGNKNISSKFNSATVKEQLEEVTDLIRSSKEASLSTASQNIIGAINEHDTEIGDITKLTTTAKDNVVNSINEHDKIIVGTATTKPTIDKTKIGNKDNVVDGLNYLADNKVNKEDTEIKLTAKSGTTTKDLVAKTDGSITYDGKNISNKPTLLKTMTESDTSVTFDASGYNMLLVVLRFDETNLVKFYKTATMPVDLLDANPNNNHTLIFSETYKPNDAYWFEVCLRVGKSGANFYRKQGSQWTKYTISFYGL